MTLAAVDVATGRHRVVAGGAVVAAQWDHHVDGFFFVAEQEPNRMIRYRPPAQ